jgi:SAM-dependent methyltransferase
VAAADRILEVGCGPGVAVALVCDRLGTGHGRITAIDRSPTAIERTRARNADHVDARRAVLRQVDLGGYKGAPAQFDKAFAVDVDVFWTTPADPECTVLARVLRPGGVVRLVYAIPDPGAASVRDVGATVAANLERHGFTTERLRGPPAAAAICITGRLKP